MKKLAILLILFIGTPYLICAQKVDSIQVEQAGDFLKIRYKILNSSYNQLFRVNILFSIGGGLKTELKSVTGDVGDQVIGGKSEYWVVWDVLKDVSELKDAEFFVRAELIKKNTEIMADIKKRNIYGFFSLETDNPQKNIGFRFAYMKSFGVSASILGGPKPFDDNASNGKFIALSTCIDITKRLFTIDNFEAHFFAGLALHNLEPYNTSKQTKFFPAFDSGIILTGKRLALTFSMSRVRKDLDNSTGKFYNFGIGLRF
jgi:hypothetical protein